jgi:hypothetical protein
VSAITDRIASDVTGIFARTSDFGTQAAFSFGSVSRSINVVFEENYRGHDVYGNEVANLGPIAICATADVTDGNGNVPGEDADNDATLTIDGTVYNITKCARESEGASMLTLSED